MSLTRVSPALFATTNNITSVTVGGSANTISLTFDGSGVITSATNNAISVANTAITGNIISSQITSVANTQITGNIISSQIASVSGSVITANTIANSAIQTGAVENYMNAQSLGFGMRNRIINGAMVIDQRNAGAAVTYNGVEAVYNLDRFQAGAIGGGSFTVQQSTTAPTGFYYSQKYTVGTADTSLAASDRYSMYQYIEGYNVADLDFGLSTAKTITVSFWVQSSITGTFGVWLANAAYSRSITSTITVNSANTWEQKTVTFTGDTTGTWLKTNLTGLVLGVSFAMGSTYQGTANTWAATAYFTTSSQTNWMATSGNTFYITGVQLEKGSTATSFDYRPYGTELQLCQRYFEMSFPQGTAPVNGYTADLIQQGLGAWTSFSNTGMRSPTIPFKVTKRTTPSITIYSSGNSSSGNLAFYNGTLVTWTSITTNTVYAQDWGLGFNATAASGTTGTSYLMGGAWTASAEL